MFNIGRLSAQAFTEGFDISFNHNGKLRRVVRLPYPSKGSSDTQVARRRLVGAREQDFVTKLCRYDQGICFVAGSKIRLV